MTTTLKLRCIVVLASLVAAALPACTEPIEDGAGGPQEAPDTAAGPAARAGGELDVADAGFATPESVLHDEAADLYLVSNINGAPLEKDGNGFISRVSPDGSVRELKWVDGAGEGVTLHAPKGMALVGDSLYVSDIDSVRIFHRGTGRPLGALGVPGATFLNDVAAGPDGTVYVTDTGMDASFEPSGTDAIFRLEGGRATPVARGAELSNPNGIVVSGDAVLMAPFGGNAVQRIALMDGEATQFATLPGGQLDGIVALPAGGWLVSSWEAGAVFRVGEDGRVTPVVEDVVSPADIGFDASRERLLIPLFQEDRLLGRPLR